MNSTNAFYNGEIKRGSIMFHGQAKMFGVITKTKRISSNPAGGSAGFLNGIVTVVFPNGEKAEGYLEQHLRKFHEIVIVDGNNIEEICNAGIAIDKNTMLAEESAISTLETAAYNLETKRNNAEEEELKKFEEQVEAMKVNADYKHLEHMNIGKMHWAKDVAKNVRKDLKKNFPGSKFSVKSTDLQVISVTIKDDNTDKQQVIDLLKKYWERNSTPFMEVYGSLTLINVNGS